MKKLLAILLALVMLLGLSACDNSGGEKPTVVGTWKGSVDFGPPMEMSLKAAAEMDDSIPTQIKTPLVVDMTCIFNADGTYSAVADKDSVDAFLNATLDLIIEVMYAPRMDLGALLEEGITMEEFKVQVKESMGMDAEYAAEALSATGYYKYEDGKIYTAEKKEDLEAGKYFEVSSITLSDTAITFTDYELDGEKMSEIAPGMFPMVFTKQ